MPRGMGGGGWGLDSAERRRTRTGSASARSDGRWRAGKGPGEVGGKAGFLDEDACRRRMGRRGVGVLNGFCLGALFGDFGCGWVGCTVVEMMGFEKILAVVTVLLCRR